MVDPIKDYLAPIAPARVRPITGDPLADSIRQDAEAQARMNASRLANPSEARQASKLARESGIPAPLIDKDTRPIAEVRAIQSRLANVLRSTSGLTPLLADPDTFDKTHDDLTALTRVLGSVQTQEEQAAALRARYGDLKAPARRAPTVANFARGVWGNVRLGAQLSRVAMRQVLMDAFGTSPRANERNLREVARIQSTIRDVDPDFKSKTMQGVYGGVSSFARMVPGLAATIATRSPVPLLATAGAQTGLEDYGRFRERGAGGLEAATGATATASIEVLTELLGAKFFAGAFGKTTIGDFVGGMLVREVPGEQIATLGQEAVDTAVTGSDRTWSDYLDPQNRYDAAYTTFVSTVVQAGIAGAPSAVVRAHIARKEIEGGVVAIDRTMEAAATSKLRQESPEDFREVMATLLQDKPGETVYVPAAEVLTLFQSAEDGTARDIRDDAFWGPRAQEVADAAARGGDVVLKMADVATDLAGSPQWKALRDHVRLSPSGMSLSEAKNPPTPEELETLAQGVTEQIEEVLQTQGAQKEVRKFLRDMGVEGAQAEALMNLHGRGLAVALARENAKRAAAGEEPLTVGEFWKRWNLRAEKTTQAAYEAGTSGRSALEQEVNREANRLNSSPEFKAWFGRSKSVNETGAPRVFYHGTRSDFGAFERIDGGNAYGPGYYFTDDPAAASNYATGENVTRMTLEGNAGPNVVPVFLKIDKPFELKNLFSREQINAIQRAANKLEPGSWKRGELVKQFDSVYKPNGHNLIYQLGRNWQEIIREAGYDGLITDMGTVVFEPTQIKSIFSQRFDPNDPNILNQVSPAEQAFYSAALRVVQQAPQERASAAQWKALLTPGRTPGIKAEEIEWSGIHDWLDMQEGPVEKHALLRVLEENGIVIDEVVLGDDALDTDMIEERTDVRYQQRIDALEYEGYSTDEAREMADAEIDDLRETAIADLRMVVDIDIPQFRDWSSDPSNPTYRELLITLPLGVGANPDRAPSTHWDTEAVVAHARFMEKTDAEGKRVLFIEEVQSDWHQKGRDEGYEQRADPAVIEAAREAQQEAQVVSSRAAQDVMMFARAIGLGAQEDVHAARRALLALKANHRKAMEAFDVVAAFETAELRLNEATQVYRNALSPKGIPEAPFKASWPALVMKRMIRWAVDNGFERVAWTTGEEQAERYDLAKHVDQIDWIPSTGELHAYRSGGHVLERQGITDEKQLAEIVGKGMAEKLMADEAQQEGRDEAKTPFRRIAGADVKVGGEGMKAFYDRNLVNITNDIVKKYGVKVGRVAVKGIAEEPDGLATAREARRVIDFIGSEEKVRALAAEMRAADEASGAAESLEGMTTVQAGPYLYHNFLGLERALEEASRYDELAKQPFGNTSPGFDITPQLRDAASSGFTLFQDKKRGNISFERDEDGQIAGALIRAFESANFSTAIHEMGHFYLEDLRTRALADNASDQEKADWATLRSWWKAELGLDVKDGDRIPVDAHEITARGMERYIYEGIAPIQELKRLFARMRDWMREIYKSVRAFDAPITPEVREVFDRIFASDAEVEAQKRELGLRTGSIEALLSEQEIAEFQRLAREGSDDAKEKLLARLMSTLRQEKTAEARQRRSEIEAEVAEQVDAMPVFTALRLLREGRDNGEGRDRVRLSRQWLVDTYGEDILDQLPRGIQPLFSDKDPVDADALAEETGFGSGDQLVKALVQLAAEQADRKEGGDDRSARRFMIEELAEERYRDEIGDPLDNLEEEAQAALASDYQADLMSLELRALARRTSRRPTAWKMATEWAKQHLAAKSVREALSGASQQMYARNARGAAQRAEEALVKGDYDTAFTAKQQQLLNMALVSEAKKARMALDSAMRRLRKVAGKKTIPSVDQDYLEQAHQLLESIDLKRRPGSQIDARKAFEDWHREQVQKGVEPIVPAGYQRILGTTNWEELSVDTLLHLDKTVAQIMELGRLKQSIKDGRERRAFDEVVAEMQAQAATLKQRPQSDLMDEKRSAWLRTKDMLARADTLLLKMEVVCDWLDGGQPNGIFNRMIFRKMADAQARKLRMSTDYAQQIDALVGALPKKTQRDWSRKVDTPALLNRSTGQPWELTKDQVVLIALNWGNAGNRQRLLDGYGWDEAAVEAVLDEHLTAEDWGFVQGVWDVIDTLWPEIEGLERRVNGIAPERVEPTAIVNRHGSYRGGYYPAVYDQSKSDKAAEQAASDLFAAGYQRATTRSSAAQDRVEKVERPIMLSLSVITRHLDEVIHDITHREAVMEVDKITSSRRVRQAIKDTLGPRYAELFRPWLQNIANENVAAASLDKSLESFFRAIRTRVTIVGLGLRFMSAIAQLAGITNVIGEVGAANYAKGLARFLTHPGDFRKVQALSGEMAGRHNNIDRDIKEGFRKLGGETMREKAMNFSGLSFVQRHAYDMIMAMDMVVTIPGWIAAFDKARNEGLSEEDAVYAADKVIRLSQGAGAAKDQAKIMNQGEGVRLFLTMFYSYFSALYGRQRDIGHKLANGQKADGVRRMFWIMLMAPLVDSLIRGDWPKDDEDDDEDGVTDDELGRWMIRKVTLGNLSSMPGIRDFTSYFDKGYGYTISPGQRVGEDLLKSWEDASAAFDQDEETSEKVVKRTLNTIGLIAKLPLGQPGQIAQGVFEVSEGEVEPEGPVDWIDLLSNGKIDRPTAEQE